VKGGDSREAGRLAPWQAERIAAVAELHRQFHDSFDDYTQVRQVEWYDSTLEPAYLHELLNRLSDEVAELAAGLHPGRPADDPNGSGHAPTPFRFLPARYAAPTSLTSLADRHARLTEVLKRLTVAAGDARQWSLATTLGDLARQFEETLWFMVVSLQDHGGAPPSALVEPAADAP